MRHRPVRRLAAALLNLLFLLAWGEPAALRPCPMHDGVATPAAAMHAMAMPHGNAGHGHESRASHVCSCLGQCCAAVGVLAPMAPVVRWQPVVRRRAEPVGAEVDTPPAAAPRLLPFANGPPRTA
jgi:hypothetical protein